MPESTSTAWRRGLTDRCLDWLYPPACAHCEAPLAFSAHHILCAECVQCLRRLRSDNSCHHCATPLGAHIANRANCQSCTSWNHRFTRALAATQWKDASRKVVHVFKFDGVRRAARPMAAEMMARIADDNEITGAEAIVPVPLHPKRQHARGYDQAHLLARELGRWLNLPVLPSTLRRIRETPPQTLLSRAERLRNLAGAFQPSEPDLGLREVILVDDVMTTGATLSECSAALREAGVNRIHALVFAR